MDDPDPITADELIDDPQRIDELEARLEQLASEQQSHGGEAALGYAMGMSLAMILSWSRNASILWCLLHGLFSWVYVIYFAVTR